MDHILKPTPQNFDHALEFLELIDPTEGRVWYFRCIHPETGKAKKVTGAATPRLLKKLAALNDEGWGIFVSVNFGGAKKADISRVDVLYVDLDKIGDGHLERLLASTLPMSLIVESSPGKHHGYLFPSVPGSISVAEAEAWMKVMLAHFGADNLHDVSRVMRVPGFWHTKDPKVRFMTRMLPSEEVPVYSRETIEAWVGTLAPIAPVADRAVARAGEKAISPLPENITNEGLMNAIKRGHDVHPDMMKLMGRMVKDERTVEEIYAAFQPLAEAVEAVRPGRGLALIEGELERMYLHCLKQEQTKKATRLAHRAEQRRIDDEFDTWDLNGLGDLAEDVSVEELVDRFYMCTSTQVVFDRLNPRSVHSFEAFVASTRHCKTWVEKDEGKGKYVPTSTLWASHPKTKKAYNLTFRAGGGVQVQDKEGHHCINLWTGWRVKGVEGDAWPFYKHVHILFGDRADDFLDWLADIIQNPGELIHRAWLHVSTEEGTGRNWLASCLLRVMHGNIVTNVDLPQLLESGYNGMLSQMCLAVVDELREGGADRWKHAQRFKQMITAETRMINPKFGRQHEEYNACQWLLFSNYIEAIPIEKGDRRIEVAINTAAPQGAAYFTHLYGLLGDQAFIQAVMWALKARDLSKFARGEPAKATHAKRAVADAFMTDDDCALKEAHDSTEIWPWPLATREQLAVVAGIVRLDESENRNFGRKAAEAGWINIGRWRLKNGVKTLFARKAESESWRGKDTDFIRRGLRPGTEDKTLSLVQPPKQSGREDK